MAIPQHLEHDFSMLTRAFSNGNVALMETTDKETGRTEYVICIVSREEEEVVLTPAAAILNCDPYERYEPANVEGALCPKLCCNNISCPRLRHCVRWMTLGAEDAWRCNATIYSLNK
jgi:hypothetical protein